MTKPQEPKPAVQVQPFNAVFVNTPNVYKVSKSVANVKLDCGDSEKTKFEFDKNKS